MQQSCTSVNICSLLMLMDTVIKLKRLWADIMRDVNKTNEASVKGSVGLWDFNRVENRKLSPVSLLDIHPSTPQPTARSRRGPRQLPGSSVVARSPPLGAKGPEGVSDRQHPPPCRVNGLHSIGPEGGARYLRGCHIAFPFEKLFIAKEPKLFR